MDVSHLSRFEELSHYLIEHGFGDVFIRTKIIDDLTFFEKLAVWLERKDTLPTRLKKFAVHAGPTMVHFVKYLSTRTDVFPHEICSQLAQISYTTQDDDLYKRKIALKSTQSQKNASELGYRYDPYFAQNHTFKVSTTTYIGAGTTHFDGILYECNLVSKKSPILKNKKGLYYTYVIDKALFDQYMTDIQILEFIAQKIDLHYNFSFSARKLVTQFTHHMHDRLDLQKVRHNTTAYLSSLSSLPKTKHKYQILKIEYNPPRYLTQFCTKNQIVFWNSDEYSLLDIFNYANETENSIIASIPKNVVLENLTEILLAPLFSHGYIITDIQPQDIIITKQGKTTLQIVRQLNELTYEQTTKLSLVFASLFAQDKEELKKIFPHSSVDTISENITIEEIENYILHFAKNHTLTQEYFQLVQILTFIKKIATKTETQYDILTKLKDYINQHLAHSLEKNYTFNKKAVITQPLRSQIKKLNIELNQLSAPRVHATLASLGYLILIAFSFLLIGSALFDTIRYEYIIVAFLVLTIGYFGILSLEEKHRRQHG
jgi:predicted unusual protein kinase regulating ubiquinone biosynthesis (AarF/ABC1/UbiB family)